MNSRQSASASPPGLAALSASGITKAFGGKLANDGVDFTARGGEIHALLGENGAGKTTLISILCGQYRPDAGTIEVDGARVRFAAPRDALRAGIGVVHQDLRQVERFTVAENVVLGTRDRVGRASEARVAEIADGLGFELEPQAIVAGLSVGERQQLEILKLLYRGMSVLILDEPTAVLAPQQTEQLFRALRTLADDGKAIVFISHRLPEVTAAADTVTVLRHGRVVAHRAVQGAKPQELASLMVGEDAGAPLVARAGSPSAPVLELAGAALGSGRRALEDIDLTVRRGEIVGVAGVSGNGQVELAELAAGMLEPERGRRTVQGAVVAFIPEDRLATGLIAGMTVGENLALRRYRQSPMSSPVWLRRGQVRVFAEQLIDRFRIPAPGPGLGVVKLSGGGLQRVIVAREMTESPDLLVAAQPSRGLDVVSARAIRAQILDARDAGAGVLLISEDLDELTELSDRLVVLLGGRIVAALPRGVGRTELGRHMTGAGAPGPA